MWKEAKEAGGEVDTRQPRQQGVSELRGCPECEARGRHAKAGKHAQELGSSLQAAGAARGPRHTRMQSGRCWTTSPASRVEDGFEEDQMGSRGTN